MQALEQTTEFRGAKILYVRFNPHVFRKGKTFFDPSLESAHKLILQTLQSIQSSELKPGMNLVYINYDVDENGNLDVFKQKENDFGVVLMNCVLRIV